MPADGTVRRGFLLPPGRHVLALASTSRNGVEGQRLAQHLTVSGSVAPAALHIQAVSGEKNRDRRLDLRHSAYDAGQLSKRAKPLFPPVLLTMWPSDSVELRWVTLR